MKYTVTAETSDACDCADCRAGRHLYSLLRWVDNEWQFVGVSLQSYASAEDCQRNHHWGIQFAPKDKWEDGMPILPPASTGQAQPGKPQSGTGRRVTLDQEAFVKSAEALERHWLP